MHLRLDRSSSALAERGARRDNGRPALQNARSRIRDLCVVCDNRLPSHSILLRTLVRQAQHHNLHSPVFVHRLHHCHELQRPGPGHQRDDERQERNGQLAHLGAALRPRTLHHGPNELPEQIAGSVQHEYRDPHLLRVLHDIRDNRVGHTVPGMGIHDCGGCDRLFLRLFHCNNRDISAERVQGLGH